LFATLIETNRKLQKEVKLNLYNFGTLQLFKNGELSFSQCEMNYETAPSVFSARQKPREEDGESVIDRASAILSLGRGSTFSVKSSFLDKLSIATPGSKVSHAVSRTARQKMNTWT